MHPRNWRPAAPRAAYEIHTLYKTNVPIMQEPFGAKNVPDTTAGVVPLLEL
jgi:hypothetical protein